MLNTYHTNLINKQVLTSDQLLLEFSLINPKEIIFKAGQYLILKIGDKSRLYSIYSSENVKNSFTLLIKTIPNGLASNFFLNLKTGESVDFQGPAGVFYLRESEKDKIFLATYSGLAPLRSMIVSYLEKNKDKITPKFNLFWGLRNYSDICLFDEFKQLAINYQQFKFIICLSRETDLTKIKDEDRQYFKLGRINNSWEEFALKQCNNVVIEQCVNKFDYYLCAGDKVIVELNQYLLAKGVVKENIFLEKF